MDVPDSLDAFGEWMKGHEIPRRVFAERCATFIERDKESQVQVAKTSKVSRKKVQDHLKFHKAAPEIQDAVERDEISWTQMRAIAGGATGDFYAQSRTLNWLRQEWTRGLVPDETEIEAVARRLANNPPDPKKQTRKKKAAHT